MCAVTVSNISGEGSAYLPRCRWSCYDLSIGARLMRATGGKSRVHSCGSIADSSSIIDPVLNAPQFAQRVFVRTGDPFCRAFHEPPIKPAVLVSQLG